MNGLSLGSNATRHVPESAKGVAEGMGATPFADSGACHTSGWEVLWVVTIAFGGLSA